MASHDDRMRELLEAIAATAGAEIDCEQFLLRAAGCLDELGPDDAIPVAFEDVAQHLRVCGECREEYQALLELVRARTASG